MKFAHHLIAASLLASLGLAATAQTPVAPTPGAPVAREGRPHHDPAKMQERMAKHQAELKQKLQITATQEGAWTSFTNAMKPGDRPQRPDREAIARMSTPERIDQMRALRSTRNAEMDRRADATKAFYAALTPDQKKVFDSETAKRFSGHGGPRHRMG
ncbi:Spy/CpxP family protein refolding chaperone [uncultured Ramlibacter sp.]|uniref:Spy/CpxP family protein refolding chaperone n=1 Tax=uncultured Ramlibacter sp. TaxID=260755 RepID=UPI00262D5D71|nr:Spy/CpxP family protein refolding chaperone [uncultured Ramlibacter sp.]